MRSDVVSILTPSQVIQSLGVSPKLINFVMTILSKLISKQVCSPPDNILM